LVTYCIPHYNNASLLKRCVKSLYLEGVKANVVVVDDCSVISEYQKAIKGLRFFEKFDEFNIQIVRNSKNRGVTYSKNRASKLVVKGWCVFLDCDDFIVEGGRLALESELLKYPSQVVFMFHCANMPVVGNEGSFLTCCDYVRHGTGSESLTAINKNIWKKAPYYGALRGYEGLGVMRILKVTRQQMYLSNVRPRFYSNDSGLRLSYGFGLLSRLSLIGKGHLKVVHDFRQCLGLVHSIKFLTKGFLYRVFGLVF
jgi:glycosyltransferase involved in cell wall biosynthesis